MNYDRLNIILSSLEEKVGKNSTIFLVGLFLMIVAALYVKPALQTKSLGNLFSLMATDPFTVLPGNYVAFRILTPFISYFLGLKGQLIIVTNNIMAAALLCTIFGYFRNKFNNPADAFYAAAVIALSQVTLITIYLGGYTDSTTYLLIFLMWRYRSRITVYFPLLFLAILNRESVIFLIPWFFYLLWMDKEFHWRMLLKQFIGYSLVAAVILLIRIAMTTEVEVPFTISYYLTPLLEDPMHWVRRWYPYAGLAFFGVFKALWLIPIMALLSWWRERDYRSIFSVLILLLCTWAQMLITFDSSRILTLGFMVMIISLIRLFKTDAYNFRKWALGLLVINLFVPQIYIAAHIIEIMYSMFGILFHNFVLNRPIW